MKQSPIPFSEVPQGYITINVARQTCKLCLTTIKELCHRGSIQFVMARAPNRNTAQIFLNPDDLTKCMSLSKRKGGSKGRLIRRDIDPKSEYDIFEIATWHGDPVEVHEWFEEMEKENKTRALRGYRSACPPYFVETDDGYTGTRITREWLDLGIFWRT
jgi:hypothetical protein